MGSSIVLVTIVLLQAAVIAGLVWRERRRRRVEDAVRDHGLGLRNIDEGPLAHHAP